MELERRIEIQKAIAKKDKEKIDKISKNELLIYIEDTQKIILTHCHQMVSST